MKMGKCIRLIAILSLMAFAFTSCSDDDDDSNAIDITKTYNFTVVVTVTDLDWIAEQPEGGFSFSDFVACTHKAKGVMFKEGVVASPLVELLASCTDITDAAYLANLPIEMKKMEESGDFGIVKKTEEPVKVGASFKYTFTSTLANRYISIVGKLMPSPDWFVGIRDLDLSSFTHKAMIVYDAGTNGGKTYTDSAVGEGKISLMKSSPLASNKVVPTLLTVLVSKSIVN
jgi:hypothetical protein